LYIFTTRKLSNTNENTNEKKSPVNYGDIYQEKFYGGEYRENYNWKSINEKKYKYDMLVL
jgi:hypothetical protein